MLPAVEEVLAQPATHLMALLLVAVTWLRSKRCIGNAAVGVSYDAVVRRGEWWRCVTATFAHTDLLHLGLNLLALRGHGAIEERHGTCYFLHVTALLCLLEPLVFLAAYHKLGRAHQSTNVLGFSGVLFGYSTLEWCQGMVLESPLAGLFQASLLMQNVSFVGHLSGIGAACLVHFLRLDRWLPPMVSLGLMAAALVYTAASCPVIRILPPALTKLLPCWLGSPTKLVGGRVLRGAAAAAAEQPATARDVPFAGAAHKLGGGSSSMRRIGGVLLPLPQGNRGASPAKQATKMGAATSPATPPSSPSYRILRFSPEAPPSA